MARFDYEAAWAELLLRLGDKPQWGERQLLEEMNAILRRNAVPEEPGVVRMLRVYGVDLQTNLSNQRAPAPPPPGGDAAGETGSDSRHLSTEEVDDGSRNGTPRVPAGGR